MLNKSIKELKIDREKLQVEYIKHLNVLKHNGVDVDLLACTIDEISKYDLEIGERHGILNACNAMSDTLARVNNMAVILNN